ncbi:AAA family ATPase [Tissierella carlieri]|uniref:AAA family ATPase n=1 Tax=Tissierella carlieri TaxID=689904 RepID=UPI003869CE44
MHLKSVKYIKPKNTNKYPFNIPLFKDFDILEFRTPVTIFVGENGTGKSTLIEGIAAGVGSITIGDDSIDYDKSLKAARELSKSLKLIWNIKTKKGFFLRAEDFISYTKRIAEIRNELEEELKEIDNTYDDRSELSKSLAKMPYNNSLYELKKKYGEGLETKFHGESFLELFNSRFVPNGLYILDEPETPLSPMKQLAFISMIKEMVEKNAQFIIATHSPILMAIPEAAIISFDEYPIKEVNYNDLEHVNLTKDFLNNPGQYLRHL